MASLTEAPPAGAPRGGLGRAVRRGAAATLSGQVLRTAITLGSTAVLARLLTPGDYGLVAMVVAVTALADQVRDLGLSAAAVQRRDLSKEQSSALFWVNVLAGVALALLLTAVAPLVAAFYGRPELRGITQALATTFLVSSVAAQSQALLQRRLRISVLARADVVATALGAGVAVVAALQGAGYWALVLQQIGTAVARAVQLVAAARFRPSRPRRVDDLRGLLRFGRDVSAFNMLNYLARNADNVLIGKVAGPGPLGEYSRAYSLLLLPLQQINQPVAQVTVPALSRLQDEPDRYRELYRSAVGVVAVLGLPLVLLMVVLAPEVVLVFLGPQWTGVVDVFRVLAVAGLLQVLGNTNGWLYLSSGRSGPMVRWALVSRPLVVLSFVLGLPWGVLGVAVAYAGCQAVLLVPALRAATRGTPVTLGDVRDAVARPAACAALLGVTAWLLRAAFDGPALAVLAVVSGVALAVYAAAVLAWRPMREELRRVLGGRPR